MPEAALKKRRSRFGCGTCRRRKVSCDERPNGCYNCERLKLECTGYIDPRSKGKPSPKRTRTRRSCNQCRVARTKCSGDSPCCERCLDKDLECSYRDGSGTDVLGSGVRLIASPGTHEPSPEPGMNGRTHGHMSESTPSMSVSHADRGMVLDSTSPGNRQNNTSTSMATGMDWLQSSDLPSEPQKVRILVTRYFQHIHPLRCFAFIHKPSFMAKLDVSQPTALVYIMSALGAQFYALEYGCEHETVLKCGTEWARKALSLVLGNLDMITIENLMTMQLLYDYSLRMANFSQAFMLSSLMARMTQALQINLEYSQDILCRGSDSCPSTTIRECRRRIMWSCYSTDALCGSGVDQLTLIKDEDVRIQLPCNEKSFLSGEAYITAGLQHTRTPSYTVNKGLSPPESESKLGITAYFIQHIEIRKRILKYIKHLDKARSPWLPDSEFAAFDNELQQWYQGLPENLQLNSKTILLRQETNQLGALCLLHCAYHQTLCDLYRIGAPALYKLRSAFTFPPEHGPFQRHIQWSLFKAGRALAAIMADAMRHGPHNLSDSWLPTIAYDSNRIMLYYLTKIHDTSIRDGKDLIINTIPYLQSNVEVLRIMRATNVVADGLHRAANTMLQRLGVDSNSVLPRPDLVLHDPYIDNLEIGLAERPVSPAEGAPDYVLNPLSIFRMARNNIPERHAPQDTSPRPEPDAQPLPEDFDLDMDMFFAPDLGWGWQPAQTILASRLENEGLLPWADNVHMTDYGAM